MSVEKKIRDFLEKSTVAEASYPGMGKNKETEAPMQGSSEKPTTQTLVKGAGADAAAKAAAATTLSASNSNGEKKPHLQGDSQATVPHEDLGKDEPGKVAASKMSKTSKQPTGKGAGQAPGFTTKADPTSVVNMSSSKGNVHQEEVEAIEELDTISEDEFNALSDEEKAQYELVEIEESITADEYEALSDEDKAEYEQIDELNKSTVQSYMKKRSAQASQIDRDITKANNSKDPAAMKKASAKSSRAIKGMNTASKMLSKEEFTLDVNSLFGDSDLSEEFRTKAASMFEAVVTARVAELRAQIEEEAAQTAAELVETSTAKIIEQVDSYLNYVAEQWIAENKVAVETGLRSEITEDFLSGLKSLFEEHYVEIPNDKLDVLEAMQERIAELEENLNTTVSESTELKNTLNAMKRASIVAAVTEGLAQTEAEKFASIVEDVSFEDEASFTEKLNVVKENYFPKAASVEPSLSDDEAPADLTESSSPTVMKYAQALGRYTFSK